MIPKVFKHPNKAPGAIIIEGHVQGLSNTRSLGEKGIPVIVIDKVNCIARYSKYCKKFFLCPDFIKDEFAYFLIDLAKKENIRDWVLLPSNDHAVYTISKHKALLEQYFKVITPGIDIIDNIYDKARLIGIAKKCDVPIPKTQFFTSVNDKILETIRFPVITRGRNGLSFYKIMLKKALIANDEQELRAQLKIISEKYSIEGTFTQSVIPFDGSNKTISFTAFCVNGDIKAYWMGIKLREHPLRFGTATFAQSVNIPECFNISVPLLKALKYTGVCEVEYLFDPREKQYKLIEINARTWLWVGLAKACGVDYAKMIYDFANHNDINYPEAYDIGKYWINPITDTVYAVLGMLKGKMRPAEYLSTLRSNHIVNAMFTIQDIKPGFAYMYNVLTFLKNR